MPGLLLARGATRTAELAIRASLGAGRVRLVRQLLTESVVLSLAGCAAGILLAWLTLDILVANLPVTMPSGSPATLNLRVLGATIALTALTGVLFGLAPAVRLSRAQIGAALARGNPRQGSPLSRRGGQLLVAAEVALAVVLVAGAGLMIRSFARLLAVDIGFDPDRVVTMEARPLDPAAQGRFYPELLRRLRALPELAAAGAIDHFSLGLTSTSGHVSVDGKSVVGVGIRKFLPGYFEALQTEPTDPATLVAVAVTLATSGCLAAWIPARRAARGARRSGHGSEDRVGARRLPPNSSSIAA